MKRSILSATAVAFVLGALASPASASSLSPLPESYIVQMFQDAAAEAAKDLRDVAEDLDDNLEKKRKLRQLQNQLDALRSTADDLGWYYVETPSGARWARGAELDAISADIREAVDDLEAEQLLLQFELQKSSSNHRAATKAASNLLQKSDPRQESFLFRK